MSSAAQAAPDVQQTTRSGGFDSRLAELADAIARAASGAADSGRRGGPLPAGTPAEALAEAAAMLGPAAIPADGIGTDAALHRMALLLARYAIDLGHPHAAAHLQPQPMMIAVAADALISAGNASMDTYDSAGAAGMAVERWVLRGLTSLAGLGERADGVFTPGGTMSNLTALLLARDSVAARLGVDVRRDGVGALRRPVVLCSEHGHFSIQRACATLGLGESAAVVVPADSGHRMRADAVRAAAVALRASGPVTPIAVVATAGTTDFGTVDPTGELADVAGELGAWLHVDAAYGFGALFSDHLAARVAELACADSITVDLHKLGWQPAAASVLLVRDGAVFETLDRSVDYLNPVDDREAGYDGLLGRTLQTTRRADAVKVAATLLAHGRRGLGRMVDVCHRLACHAESRIAADPRLELVAPATLTTVVFRFRAGGADGGGADGITDRVNAELRRRLLRSGTAVIGRTTVAGATCLKLTLLNPSATESDVDAMVTAVLAAGDEVEAEMEGDR